MTLRTEFNTLFREAGIPQRRLARLLGVSTMTANRWCTERDDGFEPPTYAVAFLRVYVMLSPAARERLPLYDAGKAKAVAPAPAAKKPAKVKKVAAEASPA